MSTPIEDGAKTAQRGREPGRGIVTAVQTRRCSVRPLSHYSQYMAHRRFPPLWVVMPYPQPGDDLGTYPVHGLGRRVLYLSQNSALCCTWREAMNYATTGRSQRPIATVYPEWCGL